MEQRNQNILDHFNDSFAEAVDAILHVGRTLWSLTFTSDAAERHQGEWVVFIRQRVEEVFPEDFPLDVLLSGLEEVEEVTFFNRNDKDMISLHKDIFHPVVLVRKLLSDLRPDHELRYVVKKSVRKKYGYQLSPFFIHVFHLLSSSTKRLKDNSERSWVEYDSFYTVLQRTLEADPRVFTKKDEIETLINLFVECCRGVGYIKPSHEGGRIDLRDTTFDPEYLISSLFGMPTGIQGFDGLFGGGGILFTERDAQEQDKQNEEGSADDFHHLNGRITLITGNPGTGKSLLALKLAVKVASMGGMSWVMTLEQSPQECLYALASIGALPRYSAVEVVTRLQDALRISTNPPLKKGVLVILQTGRDSYKDFLVRLKEYSTMLPKMLPENKLFLLCIDPTNSLVRESNEPTSKVRADTFDAISYAKKMGVIVLLVSEDNTESRNDFEENISDTVIRLSVEETFGYKSRYIEVSKSRYQREQRGRHPFTIKPESSIAVHPSSPAIRARIRNRQYLKPGKNNEISFGLPELNNILGGEAIFAGDVIVLDGPSGSLKSRLGLLFLLGLADSGSRRESRSLYVAIRDRKSTVKHMLDEPFITDYLNGPLRKKGRNEIIICPLPAGFVQPGLIFQRLEQEFRQVREKGYAIDRVMIDNVEHWETSNPFIRADETFGDTLIEFLRSRRVTSLLTCSSLAHSMPMPVQQPIIDNADTLIKFERFYFRGTYRTGARVMKTRSMKHRRDSFEVTLDAHRLDIKPGSSLLRVQQSGHVEPININLFLHTENEAQKQYNDRFVNIVEGLLSHEVKCSSEKPGYLGKDFNIATSSTLDELQILQIDEFHLQELVDKLHRFPEAYWDGTIWKDFEVKELKDKEREKLNKSELALHIRNKEFESRFRSKDKSFFAIPYYANPSLLVYRDDAVESAVTDDWSTLAETCQAWSNEHSDALFFDYPKVTPENFNCLFLEILFTLKPPEREYGEHGNYLLWGEIDSADAVKAAQMCRTLCRDSYRRHKQRNQEDQSSGFIALSNTATVWRLWYSNLKPLLDSIDQEDHKHLKICMLPGGITTAGDWYLGLPVHSAASDVGLELIKVLTSRSAELDRMEEGIGLPTRTSYYESMKRLDAPLIPHLDMSKEEILGLFEAPIRRSEITHYAKFSNMLAYHLRKIIEIEERDEKHIARGIQRILSNLKAQIEYLSS